MPISTRRSSTPCFVWSRRSTPDRRRGRLKGVQDEDVLAIAADDSRILVTHDKKIMKTHFGAFIEKRVSSGVIVVRRNLAPAAVAEDTLLIWAATDAQEWENRFVYLPI